MGGGEVVDLGEGGGGGAELCVGGGGGGRGAAEDLDLGRRDGTSLLATLQLKQTNTTHDYMHQIYTGQKCLTVKKNSCKKNIFFTVVKKILPFFQLLL